MFWLGETEHVTVGSVSVSLGGGVPPVKVAVTLRSISMVKLQEVAVPVQVVPLHPLNVAVPGASVSATDVPSAKTASQGEFVAPQSIPPVLLVPVPLPTTFTVSVCEPPPLEMVNTVSSGVGSHTLTV